MEKAQDLYRSEQIYSKLKIILTAELSAIINLRVQVNGAREEEEYDLEYCSEGDLQIYIDRVVKLKKEELEDETKPRPKFYKGLVYQLLKKLHEYQSKKDVFIYPELLDNQQQEFMKMRSMEAMFQNEKNMKAGKVMITTDENIPKKLSVEIVNNKVKISIFERTSILKRIGLDLEDFCQQFRENKLNKTVTWQIFVKNLKSKAKIDKQSKAPQQTQKIQSERQPNNQRGRGSRGRGFRDRGRGNRGNRGRGSRPQSQQRTKGLGF